MNIRMITLACLIAMQPFSALAESKPQTDKSSHVSSSAKRLATFLEKASFVFASSGGVSKVSSLNSPITDFAINSLVVTLGTFLPRILKRDSKNLDIAIASSLMKVFVAGGTMMALFKSKGYIKKEGSNLNIVLINAAILGLIDFALEEFKAYRESQNSLKSNNLE